MRTRNDRGDEVVRLKPQRAAFGTSLAVLAAVLVPLFVVLYIEAAPSHDWHVLVGVNVLVVATVVAMVLFERRAGIYLYPGGFREIGILGRSRSHSCADVRLVSIIDIFEFNSADVRPHLFATDDGDRPLLRMRGFFWTPAKIDLVAQHLDAPIDRWPHPHDIAEIRRTHPHWLYGYERHLPFGQRYE